VIAGSSRQEQPRLQVARLTAAVTVVLPLGLVLLLTAQLSASRASTSAISARVPFRAIATGAYGFPPHTAATIAVDIIRSTSTAVELVRLVAFDQPTRDMFAAALNT